ncbi:enoyl-CoA hydratase/isomerase family protein [Desulfoferula mesophila]
MKVLFSVEDHIAYITINRPEVMNAMDPETYHLLSEAWCKVRDDPGIWAAVVTGAGDKAFTAGADLKTTIPRQPEKFEFWQTQKDQILNRGLEVWKPIVAAVNGYCLAGGMTLLLATDIRVACEDAVFQIPEVKRGILPANGGTQRIARQLPYAVAMEMVLLGRRLNAQEALQFGLVNKVVPREKLMEAAQEYARALAASPPLALQAIKELVVRSQSMTLDEGIRLETTVFELLKTTEDAKEGPKAFAEKRPPVWQGK